MRKFLIVIAAVGILVSLIGCGKNDVPSPTMVLPDKTREISVFYATGRTIVEERHVVKDDKNIITTALNEVFTANPQNNNEIAIVQPQCKVLDTKVDKKGVVTVNFSKEVLDFKAVRKEKLLAYGAIIETLKQFNNVKSVKFQVEGKEAGSIGGKDIHRFWEDVSLNGQPWPIR